MIRKMLDLSTAHVSPDARKWLEAQSWMAVTDGNSHTVVARHNFGWLMHVPEPEPNEGDQKLFMSSYVHADLHPACFEAYGSGCDFLYFDGDGEIVFGLPVYEEKESETEGFTEDEIAAMKALADDPGSSAPAVYLGEFPDAGIADELAEPGELEWVEVPAVFPEGRETVEIELKPYSGPTVIKGETSIHPEDHPPTPQITEPISDRNFLLWVRDRLTLVHGDIQHVDFIWRLEAIAMAQPEDQRTKNGFLSEHPDSPDYVIHGAQAAEIKAAGEALINLMGDVLKMHVYDTDNGDDIPQDDAQLKACARLQNALLAL